MKTTLVGVGYSGHSMRDKLANDLVWKGPEKLPGLFGTIIGFSLIFMLCG